MNNLYLPVVTIITLRSIYLLERLECFASDVHPRRCHRCEVVVRGIQGIKKQRIFGAIL